MNTLNDLDFSKLLIELVELDYNAVEAYSLAVDKIENEDYKAPLQKFQQDHERHIKEINEILVNHNQESIKKPTTKQWLLKGKVLLADITGDDKNILKAMDSIEEESNKAYEEANQHKDIWNDITTILKQGLEDERKHKKWIESTLTSKDS